MQRLLLPLAAAWALGPPAPGQAATDAGPAPSAAGAAPSLVLVVAVDQMRPDYLTRFAPHFTGGLHRLLERGAVFTEARYRHACTETGPGHAVILSGRSPRSSGIVGNRWYDLTLRRRVNVVDDPTVTVLGGSGRAASPANFVGFTVGDVLKHRSPGSRVVGVSIKDRAAILLAGPRADAAYWYGGGGRFVTSTYYAPAAPAWLEAWNARRVADAYAGRTWERLLPQEAPYLELAGRDDVAGEWDRKDTVFPHRLPGRPPAEEFYDGLWRTPFADEVLLDLALEAAARHELGTRGVTDILALSFSAPDVVGHTYGPDSQEVMDHLLRFDRLLGRLFAELERRAGGPEHLLVLLASDHGVLPLVEVLQARGAPARRADPEVLERAVAGALQAHFPGKNGLALHVGDGGVTFDLDALRTQGVRRADVERAVGQALLDTGLVAAVYTEAQFAGEPPAGDATFELYRRCRFAPRSPHLEVRLAENVYLDSRPGGTGHGGPYDHDRHVPIVFMGAQVRPGRHALPCGPEDVAPALARLLGLDYPMQDAEQDLLPLLR